MGRAFQRLFPGRMAGWSGKIRAIRKHESGLADQDDEQLRKLGLSLRYRARSGEPNSSLLPQAFALVGEAASRRLKMRPYDVQLAGAIAIEEGSIAEMQTGEGKTLTATMPLFLASLNGQGAHLATANDYLAARDAEWMRPVFELLGASVGVIQSQSDPEQRRHAYRADITYGTAKEFGFDFLRDRLLNKSLQNHGKQTVASLAGAGRRKQAEPVQRELNFALVDEADSLLIDEARTPLIVSSLPGEAAVETEHLYRWAASVAAEFCSDDYHRDPKTDRIVLNAAGRRRVRSLTKPEQLDQVGMIELYEHIETSIKVASDYQSDRHYVVRDDEVVIVDEFTGRLAEGRRWRDSIHQAIEAKEDLPISHAAGDAARITVQDYFQRYQQLGGMTGTAFTSRREFRKIYGLHAVTVPTNRPPQRVRMSDRVFSSDQERCEAVLSEVQQMHQLGRPVLVGTRSIDKSHHLASLLAKAGIEHHVLNAHQVAAEAEIVAQAGQSGRVTVATNMAGRGTDIRLSEESFEAGGLHVICCELHESARIDRQLIGRCGRQGDPGSYRQLLCLEDEVLMSGLGIRRTVQLRKRYADRKPERLEHLARSFHRAQARLEHRHFRQRKLLLFHETERSRLQQEMGQDPYLDSPG